MKEEQPVRIGRRLAAIVAADVAGFSRLMGLDEVGTARTLREHRAITDDLVAKHGGRLVKSTGDGVLLEFPSVVDAVECAVNVQAVMAQRNEGIPQDRRMVFRIGINLGDILIEGEDILGDGVNVAARLEGIAEPGGICISSSAYDQVRGKVAVEFFDLGEQRLKNIERSVRAYATKPKGHAITAPRALPSQPGYQRALPLPDKPSIAVLPFQNMSVDPEQEYFAEGVVEDIITALSRFKSLFVIARNSTFTYKGKAVDIKDVGHQLGVRYVLEGSVRRAGGRIRITGQLIEAATGTHLWAEKFDGELHDVFDLQDQVTASVVGTIAPKILQAEIERARSKTTDRLESYDCFLRGIACSRDRSHAMTPEAGSWFKKAFELDPNYASAQVMVAYSALTRQSHSGVLLTAEERAQAVEIAEHACKLNGDDANVLARAAHVFAYLGYAYDRAEALIEEAISLNPNDATAWMIRGWISLMCVEPERAIESFERMLRLSPLDPVRIAVWNGMGFGCFLLGRYEEGRKLALRTVEASADAHSLCALLLNEVGAGRMNEARELAARLLKAQPGFRASFARQMFPARYAKANDPMIAALCQAGIPE